MDYLDMVIDKLSASPTIREGEVWSNLCKQDEGKVLCAEPKKTNIDPIAQFYLCMGMFAKAEQIRVKHLIDEAEHEWMKQCMGDDL
jgi:hypothetical protein